LTAANIALFWLSELMTITIINKTLLKVTVSTLLTVYWFALLIIYAVNLVSNMHWGDSVLASFYFDLYKHIDSFSRLKGFSVLWSYALIIITFLIIFFIVFRLISPIILKSKAENNKLKVHVTLLAISISYLWLLGT